LERELQDAREEARRERAKRERAEELLGMQPQGGGPGAGPAS